MAKKSSRITPQASTPTSAHDTAELPQAHVLREHLKELKCLIEISHIIDADLPLDETLQRIVNLLPDAWQYPESTSARLVIHGKEYCTPGFQASHWMQIRPIAIRGWEAGRLEISYSGDDPSGEGPFLQEEDSLLEAVGSRIRRIVERVLAEQAEEKQRALVDALKDIAAALSSTIDLDEVLDRILANIGRVVPHDAASIMLIDGDKAYVARSRGFEQWDEQDAIQSMSTPIAQSEILQKMAQTGQPVTVAEITDLGVLNGKIDPSHMRSVAAAPIIADGQSIGFISLSSTIPGFFDETHTDRMRAFAVQAGVAIRNARLLLHAREREAELELLREAAVELLASSNLQHSLSVVADTALARLPLRHVWIYLYDEAHKRLSPGVTLQSASGGSVDAGLPEALAAHVAQNRDILVITNPAEHPLTSEIVRVTRHDCQLISLPLTRGKHVIGVFTAGFEPSTGITDNTLRFLMLLAAQASAAIDTMSLRTETDERSRRLIALNELTRVGTATVDLHDLLKNLADEVVSIIDADHSFITLWDEANQKMIPAAASGSLYEVFRQDAIETGQSTLTQLVLKGGKPLVIQPGDEVAASPESLKRFKANYHAQSILALPLKAAEHSIGALFVTFEEPHEFSPAEREWVSQAAELVALAVARAQAYAEMEQRVEERTARLRDSNEAEREQRTLAEALRDTAAILNSTLDLDDVLNQILANVGRVVPHDSANIMLVENGTASLARARGYEERGALDGLLSIYFPANSMFQIRSFIQTGEPVVIPDTHVNPDWARVPESGWVRSYIGSPIWMDGEVIGFLNLDSATPDFFNMQHVERLQAFANQAAVAIKNARLYDQAKRLAVLEERQRLARDLHDAVSQTLWSASLIADVLPTLWEQDPDDGRRNLEELRELTRTARDEMRALLLELRPGAVSQTALRDLLSQLVKTMGSRTPADISLSIQGSAQLPADVQIATYRIAQEALNNVVKHANATRVEVRVEMEQGDLRLQIRDDGQGFDLTRAKAGHLGLGIMRERAEAVGAMFNMTSNPDSSADSGTQISLHWTETH